MKATATQHFAGLYKSAAGGGGVPRGYESVGALALAAGPRFPIGLVEFSWFEFS